MEHDEMRLCRRSLINEWLHNATLRNYGGRLSELKAYVRFWEDQVYGYELKAYK